MIWISAALALDAHPTLLAPSAAPLREATMQVDTRVVGARVFLDDREGHGHYATATVQPLDWLALNGVLGRHLAVERACHDCSSGWRADGLLRLQLLPVHREHLRVAAVVGAGTGLQLGLAFWASTPDTRLELDFGWGATARTSAVFVGRVRSWSEVAEEPRFDWHGLYSQAELGLTYRFSDLHQIRWGLYSFLPNVTYRLQPRVGKGRIGVEATLGYVLVGAMMGSVAVGVQL